MKKENFMKNLETMLSSHPRADRQHVADYAEIVQNLADCGVACTACADACLAETGGAEKLRKCIRTNLDCAEVCAATMRLVTRQTETPNELLHAQLHACVLACQLCADECALHAEHHEHCRLCAETCRQCQERCNHLLGEISSSGVEESGAPIDLKPLR